ncbi:MAG: glycerophosphoryl diester phosphodiesterase membrane domain-containing protein [Clostridia bacterium]|jgi:glycerophosphoryl diester phosphodiesterase|nr:glycerophosphoryl diester phosphodiesterase membrane domain-containing protein [Clostridia bacterium]
MKFFKVLKEAIENTRNALYTSIKYELYYKMILAIIFLPLINKTLNSYIAYRSNIDALKNLDMFTEFLTLSGFACLTFTMVVMGIGIFLELGGLIIISAYGYMGKKINFETAFINSFKNSKKVLSFAGIQMIFYFIVLAPFLDYFFKTSFVNRLPVPVFVEEFIYSNTPYLLTFIMLNIIGLYFFIRWIFVLHFAIIEDIKIKDALKKSSELVKDRYRRLVFLIVNFNVLSAIIVIILYLAYFIIGAILVSFAKDNQALINLMFATVDLTKTLFVILLSFIYITLQVNFITVIYFKLMSEKEYEQNVNRIQMIRDVKNPVEAFILNNKRKVFLFIIPIFISVAIIFSDNLYTDNNIDNVKVISHRALIEGYNKENNYEGIKRLEESGIGYVEIDVTVSKDNQFVLYHDPTLKRLDNKNVHIKDLDYEFLKSLDITSLDDVFKQHDKDSNIKYILDFKFGIKHIDKLIKMVEKYNLSENVLFCTSDENIINYLEDKNPNYKTVMVLYFYAGEIKNINADIFSVEKTYLTDKLIRNIHEVGKKVYVWTLNEDDEIFDFVNRRIDGIITDYPKTTITALDEFAKLDKVDKLFHKILE